MATRHPTAGIMALPQDKFDAWSLSLRSYGTVTTQGGKFESLEGQLNHASHVILSLAIFCHAFGALKNFKQEERDRKIPVDVAGRLHTMVASSEKAVSWNLTHLIVTR
jgi:hypothetical protein